MNQKKWLALNSAQLVNTLDTRYTALSRRLRQYCFQLSDQSKNIEEEKKYFNRMNAASDYVL